MPKAGVRVTLDPIHRSQGGPLVAARVPYPVEMMLKEAHLTVDANAADPGYASLPTNNDVNSHASLAMCAEMPTIRTRRYPRSDGG